MRSSFSAFRFVLVTLSLLTLTAARAHAQVPAYVPAARYYGSLTAFGVPAGSGIVMVQAGGALCGTGFVSGSSYSVDIQPSSACIGPLMFFVNGQRADQTSVLPNNLSGAIQLNLTVSSGCLYPYMVRNSACAPFVQPPAQPFAGPYGQAPATPFGGAYTQPPAPPFGSAYWPTPYGGGTPITYQSGWNLVAGPTGALVSGASGLLFTLQPGDAAYETLPSSSPLQAGHGYWALFNAPTTVSLPGTSLTSVSRAIPPGQFALIGNPFGRPATVTGASAVYTYTVESGYQATMTLLPGQGAWAQSGTGQVVITSS
jgi:hypothetical protein